MESQAKPDLGPIHLGSNLVHKLHCRVTPLRDRGLPWGSYTSVIVCGLLGEGLGSGLPSVEDYSLEKRAPGGWMCRPGKGDPSEWVHYGNFDCCFFLVKSEVFTREPDSSEAQNKYLCN